MNLSVGLSAFTPFFNDTEGLTDSKFSRIEIIIEKPLILNFEMNTTEVSCDWS